LLLLAWHAATVLNVLGYTLTAVGRPGRSLLVDVVRAAVSCLGALPLVPALGAVGSGLAAAIAGGASLPVATAALRREPHGVARYLEDPAAGFH
jgi:O-antigen/teichoic acid export membrane protein